MQKSNIWGVSLQPHHPTMLLSRIEADHYQKPIQNKYIIHKIAKADKRLLQKYQDRANCPHPHVPHIFIQSKSEYYHCVYIEQCSNFAIKDLEILPVNKRMALLAEILSAVGLLVKHYGFFYITEKMIGYNYRGKVALWIHEDRKENKRSFPINHEKLSEEIFLADFKASFGGNLRLLPEFQKARTVEILLQILGNNANISHSIYMSESPYKSSQIHHNKSHIISEFNLRDSCNNSDGGSIQFNRNRFDYSNGLRRQVSLDTLKKPISFSYLPNQLEKSIIDPHQKPIGTLTSSLSLQNLHLRHHQEGESKLKTSGNSVYFSKVLQSSSSQRSLTGSFLPKIRFSYENDNANVHVNAQGSWKKKKQHFCSKINVFSSQNLTKSQSLGSFPILFHHQTQKEPLKVSFPHTTAHTFVPFASNGNISLNFKESTNFESKGIKHIKQDFSQLDNPTEQHISEASNQVEMDLQVLFSESDGQLHSREELQQMSMIMEQFQNVLLS